MSEILSIVLTKLLKVGLLSDFCNLRLIKADKFPLHNISVLLFFEDVHWYSLGNTSQMNYSDECMKFWKFYRLFHVKALRFIVALSPPDRMSKKRLAGQFSPDKTDINFAVPTQKSVAKFESVDIDIPNETDPRLKAWQSIGCKKIKLMC